MRRVAGLHVTLHRLGMCVNAVGGFSGPALQTTFKPQSMAALRFLRITPRKRAFNA